MAGFGDNGEVGEDEDGNIGLDSGSELELIVCEQQSRKRLDYGFYMCLYMQFFGFREEASNADTQYNFRKGSRDRDTNAKRQ